MNRVGGGDQVVDVIVTEACERCPAIQSYPSGTLSIGAVRKWVSLRSAAGESVQL